MTSRRTVISGRCPVGQMTQAWRGLVESSHVCGRLSGCRGLRLTAGPDVCPMSDLALRRLKLRCQVSKMISYRCRRMAFSDPETVDLNAPSAARQNDETPNHQYTAARYLILSNE